MAEFLLWYGLIWLIGLIGLPYSFALFGRLPERGYAFSRPLGLWLITVVAWWLGNIKMLAFTPETCWLVAGLVAVGGLGLTLINRRAMWDWFRQWRNLRLIIIGELLFLSAYAFIVNFRAFVPDLNRSEKFFDYGFINAIAASASLPPPDPWYGGAPMNYYYGGQLYMAVLSKLSGTEPSTGYNVGMGLVYGLAVLSCFGLGANLLGLLRGTGRASLPGGLLSAGFIMILGNIDALRQFTRHAGELIADGKFPPYFDWPATARMIYDPMPDGRMLDILTEYPIYSWLNGDLHAHLLDIPYVTLALALILNLFVAPGGWALAAPVPVSLLRYLASGLILGAPYLINGGDFPTYLGLALVALLVAEVRTGGAWRKRLFRWIVQAGLLGLAIGFVYLPYLYSFNGMLKGTPLPDVADQPVVGWVSRYLGRVAWPGTFLAEYSVMFGLFFFSIIPFLVLRLRQIWNAPLRIDEATLESSLVDQSSIANEHQATKSKIIPAVVGIALLIIAAIGTIRIYSDAIRLDLTLTSSLVTLMALPIGLIAIWPKAWAAAGRTLARQVMLLEVMGLLILLALGPLLKMELLGPAAVLLYYSLKLGLDSTRRSLKDRVALLDSFCCGLIALAAILTLFTEVFYIRDIYTNRFNTMFKFWYQLWMLYGLAAVYATGRVLSWSQQKPGAVPPEVIAPSYKNAARSLSSRRLWLYGLVFLAVVATACPVLGYLQVTDYYQNRQGLDGEAWYSREYPTEYPAMRWLRDYTRQDPARRGVVLETNGMNYSWYARISTYTGLPTIVGWPYHELQWRAKMDDLIIWEAWLDMNRIYETTDENQAREMLRRHNVRYVFIGQIENGTRTGRDNKNDYRQYSSEALAKFANFMQPIYADPENNIFIYAFY